MLCKLSTLSKNEICKDFAYRCNLIDNFQGNNHTTTQKNAYMTPGRQTKI